MSKQVGTREPIWLTTSSSRVELKNEKFYRLWAKTSPAHLTRRSGGFEPS